MIGERGSQSWSGAPAPAKLNLFLRVLGRRADGYHELQTLFVFLDHGDSLDVTVSEGPAIERAGAALSGVEIGQDLTIRAAKLLREAAGVSLGARIRLHKRLPMGAGLGGGSSDAATTLLVLNRLWGLDWGRERLASLALSLGADVPVFVGGRAALAQGIGEQLTPVEVPKYWYLVVFPGVSLATAAVFSAPDLTRNSIPVKIRDFSGRGIGNDLESVACRLAPDIQQLLVWLSRYGEARMSGSGSCCFVDFSKASEAYHAQHQLPAKYQSFVARGLSYHPLCEV